MVALPANLRHPGKWRTQSNISDRWGKCGGAIQGNVMRDATIDERARILDLALYKCILRSNLPYLAAVLHIIHKRCKRPFIIVCLDPPRDVR